MVSTDDGARAGVGRAADLHLRIAVGAVLALTAARVAGLMLSPVNLHGDEAQYWSWSQDLAFGYFSKPPLIAWTIALTTSAFGDQEWAVRLAAPLLHATAALFLIALANRRWGGEAALWAGLVYATMPAIWLSSAVISTDALLLPIWAAALWALDRYLDRRSAAWALVLGGLIGLGLLAKYAMAYFLAGLGVLALADAQARAVLMRPATLLAAAAALVVAGPNLVWNAANDFSTVSHTAANARWEAADLRLGELVQFIGDQGAVFGPVTLALLIWAFVAIARGRVSLGADGAFLAAFAAPPLAIVAVQAFISRAHANWAAAAYVAATLLVVLFALRTGKRAGLAAAVGLHFAVGAVFATAALAPALADRVCVGEACLSGGFKRARGWPETTAEVRAVFDRGHGDEAFAAVAVDHRLLFHGIEYYARSEPLPLRMWLRFGGPVSHAEDVAPITAADGDPILIVSERVGQRPLIAADFATMDEIGGAEIDLGGGEARRLAFFAARGFAPLERGPAYEARWAAEERPAQPSGE